MILCPPASAGWMLCSLEDPEAMGHGGATK